MLFSYKLDPGVTVVAQPNIRSPPHPDCHNQDEASVISCLETDTAASYQTPCCQLQAP